MSQSQIPSKFAIPWGNSAASAYIRSIPQNSQIGITNCAASLTDGFPPLTFVPIGAGGCPPFGQDFNGILKQITQWSQWQAVSAGLPWDSAFSTAIGGYPTLAIVQSNVMSGRLWFSVADNNTANPDSTTVATTNWIVLPGMNQPGQPVPSFSASPLQNCVLANGLTVGNASSNATNLANAKTFWLFSFLWSNCATCTLFNSSGGVVSKGASAIADFAANDAIATPNMAGLGLMGADTGSTTFLSGVPVTSGSRTVPMSVLGENLHTLQLNEIPSGITSLNPSPVALSVFSVLNNVVSGTLVTFTNGTGIAVVGLTANGTEASGQIQSTGSIASSAIATTSNNTSGGSHNTVERSALVVWNISL
jgi:hypothetical protein